MSDFSSSEILNSSDCISRRAVIDALDDIETEVADGFGFQYEKWRKYFVDLSSAQLEKRTDKRTETHACDCISRQAAIEAYGDWYVEEGSAEGFIGTVKQLLEGLPSAQPDACENTCEIERKSNDMISRQDAIEALIAEGRNVNSRYLESERIIHEADAVEVISMLPPAQPETHDKRTETHACDLIDRQALCEYALNQKDKSVTPNDIMRFPPAEPDNQINLCDSCDYSFPECPSKNDDVIFGNGTGNDNICACNKYKPSAKPEPEDFEWCHDCKEYDQTAHCCHRWTKVIRQTVDEIKAEQPERKTGKWYKPTGAMPPEHFGRHRCSECEGFAMQDWKHHKEQLTDFCPHCGARMLNGR